MEQLRLRHKGLVTEPEPVSIDQVNSDTPTMTSEMPWRLSWP